MRLQVAFIVAMNLASTPVEAIYRCVDESGQISFTDIECPNAEELSFDTSPMYSSPPQTAPYTHPAPEPEAPEPEQSPPDKPAIAPASFACGEIMVHSFTTYQNLAGSAYGNAITQFQCAKVEFSLRSGLLPRLNIRSFAEQVGSSLRAVLRDGTTRDTDIAELPDRDKVDRFRARKRYVLHICFGVSPFPIVGLQCNDKP